MKNQCQRCLAGIDHNGDGDCAVCHKIPATALADFLRTQLRARQADAAPAPSRQEITQEVFDLASKIGKNWHIGNFLGKVITEWNRKTGCTNE